MKIRILCTLGPSSLRPDVIREMSARGVDLLRINLSHTPLEQVEPTIRMIQDASSGSVPICLDTEGAQVRCGRVADGVALRAGDTLELVAEDVVGDASRLTLWPATVFDVLHEGDVVMIDFDGVELRVGEVADRHVAVTVVNGGIVRSNKGATVSRAVDLPAMSPKDRDAIAIGAQLGVTHYALSFAHAADDVALLRSLAPEGAHVMAKIESKRGVQRMDEILEAADSVIIDRGDLSREVPLEYVPYYQKAIARRANRWNRSVFVATNLLESMITNKQPTIAEANDIANTLLDGVNGLVLAAETAIGMDPVGSVEMVQRAIDAFERTAEGNLLPEDRPSEARL
jgi:pyruvate kinase